MKIYNVSLRLSFFIFYLLVNSLTAQDTITEDYTFGDSNNYNKNNSFLLKGIVKGGDTDEPLVSANVYIQEIGKGTTTDIDGNYNFILPGGQYRIVISYIGYETTIVTVGLYENASLDLDIKGSSVEIERVVVEGRSNKENVESVIQGLETMSIEQLGQKSQLLGEIDVLRSIQSLSGVNSVGDGASGFNVRGGNSDENLIIQEGSLVLNPAHTLGYFSLFHPDLISSVNLYKGDQPAYYGGRLSSVLEVKLREGDNEKYSVRGGAGIASSRISLEGPIQKGKSSFLVGGRVSYMDWILGLVKNIDVKNSKALFYDVTAKVDSKISNTLKFGATALLSGDEFRFAQEVNFEYDTKTVSAFLSQLISDKWSIRAMFNIGKYRSSLFDISGSNPSKFTNEVFYLRPSIRSIYQFNEKQQMVVGAEINSFDVLPGEIEPTGELSNVIPEKLDDEKGIAISPFIQFQIEINDDLSLSTGLRGTIYTRKGPANVYQYDPLQPKSPAARIGELQFSEGEKIKQYTGWEPRISLRYKINDNNSVKASFHQSFQYLNQISNTASSTPVDIWQLSNFHISPQRAKNYMLGYFRNFDDNSITTSLQGFYRNQENIIEYKDFADLLINETIETELVQGIGKAYGVEFNFEKNSGKNKWNFNYTFSRALRKVEATPSQVAINDGEWFASNYDKPHSLNLSYSLNVSEKSILAVNFTYSTGRPTTAPISNFKVENILNIPIYSKRNQFRIPDYHRLDVSYTIGIGEDGISSGNNITISIYNLYGRKNAYSVFFRQRPSRSVEAFRIATLGSIFPAITYNFKF